jgi:HlyD family secretion protein
MTNERLATAEGVRAVIGAGAPFRLRRLRRLVRALLIVAVLALGAFAVAKRRGRATSVGPAYETMTVGRGDLRVTVTATGTLEAVTTVEVGAEVTGKLLRVNVERNARVKKGRSSR